MLKKLLYSRGLFFVSGFLVMLTFKLASKFDKGALWSLLLILLKIQITIAFRSGSFSYLNESLSSKRWMQVIERRVLSIVAHMARKVEEGVVNDSTVLFVTSYVARTGGHTRLLESYLDHMPEAKLLISGDAFFIGRTGFLEDQELVIPKIFKEGDGRVFFNKSSSLLPCVQIGLLHQKLIEICPKVVVLFNEPSDLALLVATLLYINNNKDVRAYYYHHADDFFPFLGNAFHGHIDLDSNQDAKCMDIENRTLIRISVGNRKVREDSKIRPFTIFSFVPFVKIKAESGYVKLLSRLSRDAVRIILATRLGEGEGLIKFLKSYNADLSYIKIDEQCFDISKYAGFFHVYLDTFPIGGGMSVIDALSLGVPPVINAHEGYGVFRDPILSEFMVDCVDEVLDRIKKLREDPLFYDACSVQAYDVFKRCFEELSMVNTFREFINFDAEASNDAS